MAYARKRTQRTIRQSLKRLNSKYEYQIATLFFITLIVVFTSSVSLAFASSGPIVLGTELNANGLMEYLCLGASCHQIF